MTPTVIIPSKTITNLIPCIEAVWKHEPDAPVIVVDDGLDLDKHSYERLSVIRGIKPFVFSRNINLGIRLALYEQIDVSLVLDGPGAKSINGLATDCMGVVLLNDDALLKSPGGFSLLATEAGAHPEYGIIGVTTNLTGQPLQRPRGVGLREAPHIAFVGVYIPRRTIETVGLMDERYCLDYGVDDRDYCEAVTRAGLKVGVHDGCYVDHGSLVSSFRGDPKAPKSFAKNLALFEAKCRHCDRTGEPFNEIAGVPA